MGKNFPRPDGSGVVQGDDKAMPDRGTSTGFNGDTYGADTSQSAINRQGGISGACKSDAPDTEPGCNNLKGC
jgi:hypothetical protein